MSDDSIEKLVKMNDLQTSTITRLLLRLEILMSVLKKKSIISDQDYNITFDEITKPENLRKALEKYFSEKQIVDEIIKAYTEERKKLNPPD